MSILSTSEHQTIVHGVKSTICKKSTAKSSSCAEYARESFFYSSEALIIELFIWTQKRHLSVVEENIEWCRQRRFVGKLFRSPVALGKGRLCSGGQWR